MEKWNINIVAPTGAFDAVLELSESDGQTTGEMIGKHGKGPMLDLKYGADKVTWASKIERPMPMKLKFNGAVDGAEMAGTVKFGVFASGTFTAKRAS